MSFLRPSVIVGPLPNNIANGQVEDAVPVMANLNWIINQVNANAQASGLVALLNAANSFTQVQSGIAATSPANFPIASQVQGNSFNTLSSVTGSNAIVGRVAALAVTGYTVGESFEWQGTGRNSGAVTLDAGGGAGAVQSGGQALAGGELGSGIIRVVVTAPTPVFELEVPQLASRNALITGKGDFLSGKSVATMGRNPAGIDGAVWASFSSEVSGAKAMFLGSGTIVGPGNSLALNFALSSTQITGSSAQLPINPAVQNRHPSAAKAWGKVQPNGTMDAAYPSSGASVVHNSTGVWTITMGVTFPNTFYVVVATVLDTTAPLVAVQAGRTATTFTLNIFNLTAPADPDTSFSYVVYGNLAAP